MKGKILTGSIIVIAIAFSSLAGNGNLFGVKAASANTYPINSFTCATVTFGAFGNCINGIQSRDVIDVYPIGCSLSSYEQSGRTQVCGKVLGVKIYGAGSLLRSPSGKIYLVMAGQTIKLIPDVNSLQAYAGHKMYNVSAATIAQYQQTFGDVLGVKIYADGNLLRAPDKKIYFVVNGQLQYIHTLQELYQYRNHKIIDVSAAVIANFQ